MNTKKTHIFFYFFFILYVNFIENTLAYNDDRVFLIIEEFSWKGYGAVHGKSFLKLSDYHLRGICL